MAIRKLPSRILEPSQSITNLSIDAGYGSTAPIYGVRAWVNFNGTGTVAIQDSANVSSVTDNGTGHYTVNFTSSMPDVNYCATSTCTHASGIVGNGIVSFVAGLSVSSTQIFTNYVDSTGAYNFDPVDVCFSVTR